MKKYILFAIFISLSIFSYAQKKNLVLHYDFSKSKGVTVKDNSRSHADANLMNGATVSDGCLVLSAKDAYLDMTAKAGEVMKSLRDFTVCARYFISADEKITGYGYFLWCFSTLEANKEKEGPYHAYRINEQRCETSIGGWSQETGIQKSEVSKLGKWVNVIFRQKQDKGELFIDGKLIGAEIGFPEPANIFTSAPSFNWIGRAPFNGDNYLRNTKVSDFRIYNKCISDKEMQKIYK